MVVVKIELIKSLDSLDSRPYKIFKVHDNGIKCLLTTERLRESAVKAAQRLAYKFNVSLIIHGYKLQSTARWLARR